MADKINYDSMKKLFDEQLRTFVQKNSDYENSFERSLENHGLLASIVRMEDKMNRISTLVDGNKHAEIASESLVDTLRDLSNYSAMTACWLDDSDGIYNEENLQKIAESTRNFAKMFTIMRNSHYDVKHHSDGGLTVFYKNGEDDSDEEYKLSNFEGHQEKVNEREHYERDGISDEEIIKNWGLVGDRKTVRSRTTGQYLVEDDNPELFHKIFNVLKKNQTIKQWTDYCVDDVKETLDSRAQYLIEEQSLTTELKGLENGYFIRQHKNPHNSYRYTLAFNPEGTLKVEGDVAKPYVIECFSNDHDGTNTWAIHVFDTREDMVAALNYDLRVRRPFESKNFGDSIKELDVKVSVFTHSDAPKVLNIWDDTFGEVFNNQMLSKDLNTEESIEKYQGIKTFGPVFISEKTGALVIKGNVSEDSVKRPCGFIWFGDTKEVLLEVDRTLPKFNYNGIIYGVTYDNDKYVRYYNPLYDTMLDKILRKFYSWSVSEVESELKNLVFFNEDDE